MKSQSPQDIKALLSVMARLRDPQGGCPWDLEQDFHSLVPHTLEEAYEVADAVSREDGADLQEELGDLLLQVVFYAQMAAEAGSFQFGDVVQGIVEKLIRRHPHVFGDEQQSNATGVLRRWEEIKAQEKADKSKTNPSSLLDGVPANLPALMQSAKLQKKAAKVGFDWPSAAPIFAKVTEELNEVKEANAGKTAEATANTTASAAEKVQEEMGDLLFACVNLARHLQVDPETALRRANLKFRRRFKQMEIAAPESGLKSLSAEQLETLWQAAKDAE